MVDFALENACIKRDEQLARLLLARGADSEKQLGWADEKKWCLNIQLQMQKEQDEEYD